MREVQLVVRLPLLSMNDNLFKIPKFSRQITTVETFSKRLLLGGDRGHFWMKVSEFSILALSDHLRPVYVCCMYHTTFGENVKLFIL